MGPTGVPGPAIFQNFSGKSGDGTCTGTELQPNFWWGAAPSVGGRRIAPVDIAVKPGGKPLAITRE